jgi:hypothetical protein
MTNLTVEQLKKALFYDKDSGLFYRKLNNDKVKQIPSGSISKNGYVTIRVMSKLYYAHRLAWLYNFGAFPNQHVDHINNVRTDNRIDNLRDVSRYGNNQNLKKAQKNNKTKFLGVSFSGNKQSPYRARIFINGIQKQIGLFQSAEEAHFAYLQEKKKHHINSLGI